MNHIIKRQSIFTPHKWLSPQIEYFFEKLSTMPLAKTLLEMDDQVQICFKQSIEWVEEKYCHEKTLLLCPEALAGYHIPNQNICLLYTSPSPRD